MLDTASPSGDIKPPALALSDAHHDFVRDVFGVDPRSYSPVGAMPPGAPPGAPPPPADAATKPPMTPAEAKADLARRYAAYKSLYERLGQEAADNSLPPEDRLTPAELKLGTMSREQAPSAKTVDDKGITTAKTTTTTGATLGPDGKPAEFTHEATITTNVGLTGASRTAETKATLATEGRTTTVDHQDTKSVDLATGEVSRSTSKSVEVKTDSPEISVKTETKTTDTVGMSGASRTTDNTRQVGDHVDSNSTTVGVARSDGQLGASVGETKKSSTMVGPADKQVVGSGTETTNKLGGGLVSDDKGTGIGGTASHDNKRVKDNGVTLGTTVAAGGRCQALVTQVEGADPPRFAITTTITFNVALGASAGKEAAAKPGEQKDTGAKANVTVGINAAVSASASFKHELSAADAADYVAIVKANGSGGKLPEHKILATGASQGWAAAQQLWAAMNGSAEQVMALKPGEEVETDLQAGGGGKVDVTGGESAKGGVGVGVGASGSLTHRIHVKSAGLPDGRIQMTATIEDSAEHSEQASVSAGMAGGKAGVSHGEGQGRTIVFVLDPKDPACASQIKAINAAATPEELDRIAAQNKGLVSSRTEKKTESDGSSAGASLGPVAVDIGGKGTISNEVTRDAQGNVIGSKSVGTNQGGGTVGIGDVKVGDSKTETYVGEVDKDGHAKGEISQATTSTSASKTFKNVVTGIAGDPLGTVLHPGKLVGDEVQAKGTAIADAETMSICAEALNKAKWNGKVGGNRHDDWVACGNKIRAAITLKDGDIVAVNKPAVQQALAEWTKSDSSGRTEVLDSIIRPLGGAPTGKAFAFPDSEQGLKADWDALVIADPLDDARAKLAAKQPQAALASMQAVKGKVASLHASVNTARREWVAAGMEIQHAEMLGHITTRANEIDKAIHDLAKPIPAPAKPGEPPPTPKPDIGPPTEDQAKAKEQEDRQRADDARADLVIYNNNIEVMHGYADTTFAKLGDIEAKLKRGGDIIDAVQPLKEVEDLIKIWDGRYWPTYQLYDKWSKFINLDKSRLEKLHTAGATARWKQVYDLTRDKSMAGRE